MYANLTSDQSLKLFKAACSVSKGCFQNLPGAKKVASDNRQEWEVGDIVDVWSKRKKKWYTDGVITEKKEDKKQSPEDPFYIKVRYSFVTAWVCDLNTSKFFRRPTTAPPKGEIVEEVKAVEAKKEEKEKKGSEKKQKSQEEVMREAIKKLKGELKEAVKAEEFQKCDGLKTQIDRLENELKKMDKDKKSREAAIRDIKERVKGLEKKKAEAAKEQDYAQAGRLKNQIADLQGKIDKLSNSK
eukprot:CAMPEP_0167748358 /NCGR_PEP_ID=MMETSP0110_2-20121227/4793_1 /TAXON_ID=629695 /ORGANISM="Gymnochlora sp., Strain CCMP2014" /LENGTH=241 /DNA_ID=CAMNT_0007633363 /DNA_START=210 /DNA_END=935 /DNA_ORIENTATION=-